MRIHNPQSASIDQALAEDLLIASEITKKAGQNQRRDSEQVSAARIDRKQASIELVDNAQQRAGPEKQRRDPESRKSRDSFAIMSDGKWKSIASPDLWSSSKMPRLPETHIFANSNTFRYVQRSTHLGRIHQLKKQSLKLIQRKETRDHSRI